LNRSGTEMLEGDIYAELTPLLLNDFGCRYVFWPVGRNELNAQAFAIFFSDAIGLRPTISPTSKAN